MSYAPPTWNAVDFTATGGLAYVPLAWNAVDFNHPPVGTLAGTLLVQAVLAGCTTVIGDLSAPLNPLCFHAALVGFFPPIVSFALTKIPVYGSFSGIAQPCAILNVQIPVRGSLVGAGAIIGDLDAQIPVIGALTGATYWAAISAKIPVLGALTGYVQVLGSIAAKIPISGALVGNAPPCGILAGAIKVSGALVGNRGATGQIVGQIPISGAILGAVGAGGGLAGSIKMLTTLAAKHGISGALSARIPIEGALQGAYFAPIYGTLAVKIPMRCSIFGDSPGDPIDCYVHVLTKTPSVRVRTKQNLAHFVDHDYGI